MPLHRWPGGSLHPARRGVGRVLVLSGDGDRGEEEPVSRRPANRDRGHVLQESARSRFDRHVVDHPGALQNVRHRAAIVTDSEEPGGGPRELDIRAFQTGRRIRASERADDRLLNRSIGTFLASPAVLIWTAVGGGSVCHGKRTTTDNQRARLPLSISMSCEISWCAVRTATEPAVSASRRPESSTWSTSPSTR